MRPDLPLILIVVAVGVALALFADAPAPVAQDAGLEAAPEAPDPVDDFLADFDPVFADCFGDVAAADAEDADPEDLDAVVDQVSERVERLRGLRFKRPVDARFLDPEELREEVEALVEEELPVAEVRREDQVLKELGAIPADGDLEEITTEALGSQVAGLYDPTSKELLVQSSEEVGRR